MKWYLFLIGVFSSSLGLAQVNLQTGAATASFPLFQYTDAKSRLSTGISLDYISGNGLKVDHLASSVGSGWALQVGGAVTRIQYGEPDDQQGIVLWAGDPSYFLDKLIHPNPQLPFPNQGTLEWFYANGYLYSPVSPQTAVPNHVSFSPVFNAFNVPYKFNLEDREQDVFVVQFNGRTEKFVIGKNWVPQCLTDTKLKIEISTSNMLSEYIRTRISAFTITDEGGIKYKFATKEVTEVIRYDQHNTIDGASVMKGTVYGSSSDRKVVTKWFLTEIVNPFTNEKITFNYTSVDIDVEGDRHVVNQVTATSDGPKSSQQTMQERTKMVTQRLTSISFPDQYSVSFTYMPGDRIDLPGDKALSDIDVLYNSKMLYGYHFNYQYFYKQQIKSSLTFLELVDKRFARLCLTGFSKKGTDGVSLPANEFSYCMSAYGFPPMYSLFEDHWGYYNVLLNVTEGASGYPASNFGVKQSGYFPGIETMEGTLKSIKYPYGGTLQFEFEINQAESSPYDNKYAGGVRVKKTTLYDGISHNNDIIKDYKYVKENGTSSAWGFELPVYTENKVVRVYKGSENKQIGIASQEIAASFIKSMLGNLPKFAGYNGGVSAATFSKAAVQAVVVYIIALIIDAIFSDPYKDYNVTVIKNDNINLINPLPMQYNRVEVVDAIYNTSGTLTGTNGKTVYEFTDNQTFALLDQGTFNAPYSPSKPRSADWAYGLPKIITWYNATNQPVRKVENIYNPIVRQLNTSDFLSRTWYVNKQVVVDGSTPLGSGYFDNTYINTETFYPVQGRTELTKSIETTYNAAGNSTSTETFYDYSASNFLPRTVYKKDSKGDLTGTTTYYVSDYNISGVINLMKNGNMVNLPVSVNTWIKSPQEATRQLTGSIVTEYIQLSNNDLKPFQVFQSEMVAPQGNTFVEPGDINFDPANFKNYSYLKPKAFILYVDGNPVQKIGSIGNSNNTTIYDYGQRLAVAEVSNASLEEVKYTSFEAEGNGGWIFSPNGVINDVGPTGKRTYDLSKGAVTMTSSIGSNKQFIISLWSTQSQVTINTASGQYQPVKTGPAINGWTYFEFELFPTNLNGLSISGNGKIDELRLYPKNARMTTYTWDPGIGITSQCDVNNRIIYSDYDGFGRIKSSRDQYRNLIKAYEYNYKQ